MLYSVAFSTQRKPLFTFPRKSRTVGFTLRMKCRFHQKEKILHSKRLNTKEFQAKRQLLKFRRLNSIRERNFPEYHFSIRGGFQQLRATAKKAGLKLNSRQWPAVLVGPGLGVFSGCKDFQCLPKGSLRSVTLPQDRPNFRSRLWYKHWVFCSLQWVKRFSEEVTFLANVSFMSQVFLSLSKLGYTFFFLFS